MPSSPTLLCLDFRERTARRYERSLPRTVICAGVASLGKPEERMMAFGSDEGRAVLERFRATGGLT